MVNDVSLVWRLVSAVEKEFLAARQNNDPIPKQNIYFKLFQPFC